MSYLADLGARHERGLRDRPRRTARPRGHYERHIACVTCRVVVAVFEACQGARDDAGHRFIDPAEFTCFACSDTDHQPVKET